MGEFEVSDLPTDRALQIAVFGRRGSGKSEITYAYWDSWDGDRVVIDVTGDFIGKHPDPETRRLEVPPPDSWPEDLRKGSERLSLQYVPDHKAKDWREDCDRVVGMAYEHGDCLLVVEEVGDVAPVGLPLPHTRRALHMGRHQNLFDIFNGPRPMGVDPLVLANADVVIVYDTPNPNDRRRIADAIGWDPAEFDDAVSQLGDHEYLRYVAKTRELLIFPPIPLKKRQTTAEKHTQAEVRP